MYVLPVLVNSQLYLNPVDKRGFFYHLKSDEGVAQNSISRIAQDSVGMMWFATKNGVLRYDGKKLHVYKYMPGDRNSIQDNFVNVIFVSPDGTVWCGNDKGISVYDRRKDCFVRFADTVVNNAKINSIFSTNDGHVWFLDISHNILYEYNTNTGRLLFHKPDEKDFRLVLAVSTEADSIYITTDEEFMLRYDRLSNKFFKIHLLTKHEKDKLKRIKSYFGGITVVSGNVLLIGSNYGFLLKYVPGKGIDSKVVYKKLADNSYLYLMSIVADKDGNIWFGTWFDGLYKWNVKSNGLFHFMPEPDNDESLSNNIIESLFIDNAGYLWAGTEFGGINIYKKNKKFNVRAHNTEYFTAFPPLPFTSVAAISDGYICVGTDMGGLYRFRADSPAEIKKIVVGAPEAKRIFSLLYDDDKKILWIGTEKGLYEMNTMTWKVVAHHKYERDNYNSLSGNNIISLCKDKNGNIWAGTIFRGVTEYNPGTGKYYRYLHDNEAPEAGLSNNYVTSVVCDNDAVWIGTLDGLNRVDLETGAFLRYYAESGKKGLSSSKISSLFVNDGKIWIGTEGGGLNCYDTRKHSFTNYTVEDGLPSNDVKAIVTDREGRIWFSTTSNIVCLSNEHKFIVYGESDGLKNSLYIKDYGVQDLEFMEGFAGLDSSGRLYFGGIAGFFAFNPDSLPVNDYKPPVIIDNITVNGDKVNTGNNKVELAPGDNHLEISLAVLNFVQPEKNKYAFFLENYDSAWTYGKSLAEYFNLPPGRYKFYYKGANNDGVWSETNVLFLTVLPRFYQTKSFIWLNIALLVLIALFFAGYHQYMKVVFSKKKKELRYATSNVSHSLIKDINDKMLMAFDNDKLFLQQDLTLQKLARSLDVNPNYLSQAINTLHNCNFRELINKYRINYAKKLLRNSDMKIEAVAYESGFKTISTFNVAFKKETGKTPSEYRRGN